jgi:hypothetical protein
MKLFWLVFFVGLFFYYFVVMALKVGPFSLDIMLHTLYYFFSGFIILGGWCIYKTEKHLKIFIILVISIVFIDDLIDVVRGVADLTMMMLAYNLYLMFWGALAGITFMSYLRRRFPKDL